VLELVKSLNNHPARSFANAKPDYMLDAGGTSNEVAFSISFTYLGAGGAAATTPANASAAQSGAQSAAKAAR
jgi:hypothetical protein